MNKLIQSFIETFRKERFSQPLNFLLAISGGADSMVMLYAFQKTKALLKTNLFVTHINYHLREEDSNKYIRSQAALSDIKIAYYAPTGIAEIGNGEEVELALRIELDTNIDINDLLDKLNKKTTTLQINHDYGVSNQILDVYGAISVEEIKESMYGFIGDYDEFVQDVVFENNLNGFLQLFFIYCVVFKAKNNS